MRFLEQTDSTFRTVTNRIIPVCVSDIQVNTRCAQVGDKEVHYNEQWWGDCNCCGQSTLGDGKDRIRQLWEHKINAMCFLILKHELSLYCNSSSFLSLFFWLSTRMAHSHLHIFSFIYYRSDRKLSLSLLAINNHPSSLSTKPREIILSKSVKQFTGTVSPKMP